MLDAGRLSLIVRAGAGYNTIDVAARLERGIYVSNCPGKNAVAVAELAFGLILALDRRIPDNVAELRAGNWNKKEYSKARGLYGRTLGLLGFGSIGQEMSAARARVRHARAWSGAAASTASRPIAERRRASSASSGARPSDRPGADAGDVAERADIVSVHLALTRTRGASSTPTFLDAHEAGRASSSTPRAPKWSTTRRSPPPCARRACASASTCSRTSRRRRPATSTTRSVALPGVYGTHHIGASTDQAQEAIAAETVRIVRSFKETGQRARTSSTSRSRRRRRTCSSSGTATGRACSPTCSTHLREADLNVQETENIIFEGAEAAVARINLDGAPSTEVLSTPSRPATPTSSTFNSSKLGEL